MEIPIESLPIICSNITRVPTKNNNNNKNASKLHLPKVKYFHGNFTSKFNPDEVTAVGCLLGECLWSEMSAKGSSTFCGVIHNVHCLVMRPAGEEGHGPSSIHFLLQRRGSLMTTYRILCSLPFNIDLWLAVGGALRSRVLYSIDAATEFTRCQRPLLPLTISLEILRWNILLGCFLYFNQILIEFLVHTIVPMI